VPPELSEITDQLTLTPAQYVGIPIALFGAILISLGTQLQHTGVSIVGAKAVSSTKAGLGVRQLLALFARPSWVLGTLVLGIAILFQLTSLGFAPLIVVQPLGAIALVVTSIMNSRISKVKLDGVSIRAIVMCIGGVGLFVTIAAFTAKSSPITEVQLSIVLIILTAVLIAFAVLFVTLRSKFQAIFYIVGAGVLFGFVATLAKVVIDRVKTLSFSGFQLGDAEWLTVLCVIGMLIAVLLGSYFVQSAYSNGPPDLVVAGLTVIDPLVAIAIGIIVLGEASKAPLWAIFAFVVAGAIAIFGVVSLARNHPQLQH
jgi:drug/metabolite transporter (DMT)-like permease